MPRHHAPDIAPHSRSSWRSGKPCRQRTMSSKLVSLRSMRSSFWSIEAVTWHAPEKAGSASPPPIGEWPSAGALDPAPHSMASSSGGRVQASGSILRSWVRAANDSQLGKAAGPGSVRPAARRCAPCLTCGRSLPKLVTQQSPSACAWATNQGLPCATAIDEPASLLAQSMQKVTPHLRQPSVW